MIKVKKIIILKISIGLKKKIILLEILEKIKIREAIACTRKYLIAVSVDKGFNLIIIRGIILIKLISSPSQHVNQFEALIAITEPTIKVTINTNW